MLPSPCYPNKTGAEQGGLDWKANLAPEQELHQV